MKPLKKLLLWLSLWYSFILGSTHGTVLLHSGLTAYFYVYIGSFFFTCLLPLDNICCDPSFVGILNWTALKDKESFEIAFSILQFFFFSHTHHTFQNINSVCLWSEGELWNNAAVHEKTCRFLLPTAFHIPLIQHTHQVLAEANSCLKWKCLWAGVISLLQSLITDVG